MTIRKKITSIGLAGLLVLSSACGYNNNKSHSQYKYNGKIGKNQVTFIEKMNTSIIFGDDNIL